MQTIGIGQNVAQQRSNGYVNPFNTGNAFNIQPPLLGELSGFDLGGEVDSSGDFMNFESALMERQRHINILDDQSDGEIGPSYAYDERESYGEIKPGKLSKEETKDWLGQNHDATYWKYVYLTEPDTILHTKDYLLPSIRHGLDQGLMFFPHRLQPLPHEYDLPPAGRNTNDKNRPESQRRHITGSNQGRFVPASVHPFSDVTSLSESDHCCDDGPGWWQSVLKFHLYGKGWPNITGKENCGTIWWACGFRNNLKQTEFNTTYVLELHKRLLPYTLMRLDYGTKVVFGSTQHGRKCHPSKEVCKS